MQTKTQVRLTAQEAKVLSLKSQGMSSKEAADAMFISKRTVDFHLANIYSKLGTSNLVAAMRKASELGVMPS